MYIVLNSKHQALKKTQKLKSLLNVTHIAVLLLNAMLTYNEKSMLSFSSVPNHHALAFVLATAHITASSMASTFTTVLERKLANLRNDYEMVFKVRVRLTVPPLANCI